MIGILQTKQVVKKLRLNMIYMTDECTVKLMRLQSKLKWLMVLLFD